MARCAYGRVIEPIMDILEHAAFAGWPALEEHDRSGWRLRFANGYTKRANSANATSAAGALAPQQIDDIEAFYRARSVTPVFRLPSFCTDAATDAALADRGYRFVDPSLVLTLPLQPQAAASTGERAELLSDASSWLQAFMAVSGESSTAQPRHLDILQAIRGETAMALVRVAGAPACCGLGVVVGTHLGLFDIATHTHARGRGLATQLCASLLDWGRGRGATTAFLQVASANAGAIHVYETLGFRHHYHYWYRVHPQAR